MSDEIAAAGGWCAPSAMLYEWTFAPGGVMEFPKVTVNKGGIKYERFEETPAQAAMRAFVARQMEVRNATIDRACVIGMANGWDIHIIEPPTAMTEPDYRGNHVLTYMRPVGIEFTPAKHRVPTLTFRQASQWDEFDVWDEDE